jgi:hypothetical protein
MFIYDSHDVFGLAVLTLVALLFIAAYAFCLVCRALCWCRRTLRGIKRWASPRRAA